MAGRTLNFLDMICGVLSQSVLPIIQGKMTHKDDSYPEWPARLCRESYLLSDTE